MTRTIRMSLSLSAITLLLASSVLAQTGGPYDLTWSTIDSGGYTFSTGGTYSLGGTIGQHDAGALTGGTYSLVGGFWPAAAPSCACPGDMNGDNLRNGGDIQLFVSCIISPGSCACADVNGDSNPGLDDVGPFVSSLLASTPCP